MQERKEHAIEVLRGLLAEWNAGAPKRWENVTIPDYIEAMAAGWLGGFERVYVNTGGRNPADDRRRGKREPMTYRVPFRRHRRTNDRALYAPAP
jgi:hypothetical protein